jgi:hypothetical protein
MIPITPILVSVAPNTPSSSSPSSSPRGLRGGNASEASTQAPIAAANGASCCRSARQTNDRLRGARERRGLDPPTPPSEALSLAPRGKRRRGGGREAAEEETSNIEVGRGRCRGRTVERSEQTSRVGKAKAHRVDRFRLRRRDAYIWLNERCANPAGRINRVSVRFQPIRSYTF